ncbi:MAG: septum formation initiator family protein [Spirochaetes bacterium]|nr:septum formation initiator family protein [Spirochaetota bacterium]
MEIRNRRAINIIVTSVIFLFLAWLGYAVVHGNGGILERRNTERMIACLEEEIGVLEHEIARTDLELSNLKNNKKHLTQTAREFGYMHEGELVFRFMSRNDVPKK